MEVNKEQEKICSLYNVNPIGVNNKSIVGISLNVKDISLLPLNGLRHKEGEGTSGWYIWAGFDYSDDPDFFVPLHVEHLSVWRPEIIKYLALPPGFRFLIGENDFEDIWYDEHLLKIN
jgi:hypothetical protein